VAFDHAIRAGHGQPGGTAQLRGQAYPHASLVPFDQVDLSTPEDHGQRSLLDGVAGECQGVCGG
jgi:hypothetical protein